MLIFTTLGECCNALCLDSKKIHAQSGIKLVQAKKAKNAGSLASVSEVQHGLWVQHSVNRRNPQAHYNDVIMGAMASQITSLTIVYLTVYSGAEQRKHQSSASLAFVRGIHRWPVNSRHRWIPHTKASNAEFVSMWWRLLQWYSGSGILAVEYRIIGGKISQKRAATLLPVMMTLWSPRMNTMTFDITITYTSSSFILLRRFNGSS